MIRDVASVVNAPPIRILNTLRELGELKRIRSAAQEGSIAERHFGTAWSALVAGLPPDQAWRSGTAAAMAATRLGDIDRGVLAAVGINAEEGENIITRAANEAAAEIEPILQKQLCFFQAIHVYHRILLRVWHASPEPVSPVLAVQDYFWSHLRIMPSIA